MPEEKKKKIIAQGKKDDYPFLADWFAVSLRWLVLLGVAYGLLVAGSLLWPVIALVLFGTLWNLLVSLLAVTNRRLPAHRLISMLIDLVLAELLFILSGDLNGPLQWVGLLVIFSAGIYYEWRGSIFLAILLTTFQAGWRYLSMGELSLQPIVLLGTLNLLGGILFGILSSQLMRGIRRTYQDTISKRKENDQHLQRKERSRMQSFYQMIETLSATLDYQVVLDTALDISYKALDNENDETNRMVCAVLLFSDHDLVLGPGRGFPTSDLRLSFPAEKGVLMDVIQNAKPKMISSVENDPELSRIIALRNCQSILCLPLHRGLSAFGVMLYAHPDPRFFNADRCEVIEMISHQAVIAIQNARLFQDVGAEKNRIIETQEEARKQLARDLHDGPTQSVAGIAMRIDIARKLLERDVAEADKELLQVGELARRTSKEIRTMLFTLRPLMLEADGLQAALLAMAEKMRDTYQQNVIIDVDPDVVVKLEMNHQVTIFYLVEEAVNNARKHAKATEIKVQLRFVTKDRTVALLEIADNGYGFDVQAVKSSYETRGSLGMLNLQERSDLINAVLHIDSKIGKGTSIQVAIPLTQEAADRLQRSLGNS